MENKSLADKAVNIKGKQYVLVQDRVLYFNEAYPNGSITADYDYYPDIKTWVVRAKVIVPAVTVADGADPITPERVFTGCSQAVIGDGLVNRTAALENAETSAVGRALAFMGIGVIESIASADEMHKVVRQAPEASKQPVATPKPAAAAPKLTQRQEAAKDRIRQCLGLLGEPNDTVPQVAEAVKRLTGLELQIANFEVIGEKLGKLVEDSVDPTK